MKHLLRIVYELFRSIYRDASVQMRPLCCKPSPEAWIGGSVQLVSDRLSDEHDQAGKARQAEQQTEAWLLNCHVLHMLLFFFLFRIGYASEASFSVNEKRCSVRARLSGWEGLVHVLGSHE